VRSLDEVVALSRPGLDEDIIAAAANNLGNIHRRRGQYDLALESFQRSLVFNQAPGREAQLGRTLNNIGAVHQQRGDFRMAVDYFLQSLVIKERVGQPDELISTLGNIGGVYALQGNRPQAIEAHAKVNTYHLTLFAKFVERLRSTPDGDGSLLDQSLILYGSGMGNGNVHSADLLPTLLVGGAAGSVKGGRHIVGGTLTPNADLLISMAETFGVELEHFGGNKGRIPL